MRWTLRDFIVTSLSLHFPLIGVYLELPNVVFLMMSRTESRLFFMLPNNMEVSKFVFRDFLSHKGF